uniref:hypothetical protein n=1 Tax=Streptomyces sp. W9 TaxID=682410 RepID=UPI001867FE40|nr:hypothetical protein [Streptomyces sp. W9]
MGVSWRTAVKDKQRKLAARQEQADTGRRYSAVVRQRRDDEQGQPGAELCRAPGCQSERVEADADWCAPHYLEQPAGDLLRQAVARAEVCVRNCGDRHPARRVDDPVAELLVWAAARHGLAASVIDGYVTALFDDLDDWARERVGSLIAEETTGLLLAAARESEGVRQSVGRCPSCGVELPDKFELWFPPRYCSLECVPTEES